MSEYRKLIAAIATGAASSLASGGDWRVIVISILGAIAVWAVPNAPKES